MVKNIRAIYTVHITYTEYVYVSIKYPDILNSTLKKYAVVIRINLVAF
jgi:hypothetical protein